ncbi:MAG TPA: acyl-CoA dehydratase activase-related protein [Thermodesulfovibrionales bacterium]|nr:acyl-CoA dehydratase activase-related protein [Thermodesulfovibrionales bacterium]
MRHLNIGIPRGLLFHSYGEAWKLFFRELGCEVTVSPETNADILKEGIRHTVGDLCLPVKTFLGHVAVLKDNIDLLFIPRYVSAEQESYMCPKMIGLPDVARASMVNLPAVLDPMLHVKLHGEQANREFAGPVAKALSLPGAAVSAACDRHLKHHEPPAGQHGIQKEGSDLSSLRGGMNIAVIGRPYLLFDRYLSKNLFHFIRELGANPVYWIPDAAGIREAMAVIPKWVYWDMGKEVVAAAHMFFKDDRIDGVVNVCSATCGPDSFTGDLIRKRLNQKNKPYMSLSLDEHASDVGIQTRLEAFIDMIAKVTA